MKKSSLSQFTSILLLFLIIVGAVLITLPLREKVSALMLSKQSSAQLLQAAEVDLQELNQLVDEVAKSEATKRALIDAVPSGLAQDALIVELTALAEKAGFSLNAMNFSQNVDQVYGNTLSVAANLTGKESNMIAFLQALENSKRLLQVSNLNVQLTSTEDIVFSLNIEAYYQ